jgi:hypothetical protein
METTAHRPPHRARVAQRAAVLLLAVALAGAGAATAAGAVRGTYRLRGVAQVDAGPALSRNVEGRADAFLSPGAGPRAVRARLAAEGRACELDATLGEGGALAFQPGQRCAFAVDEPDARGRVEARLRSGRGRCADGKLALELVWELSGALSLRTGDAIEVLGRRVELPAAWTPELPLRGEARTEATGTRDESRAAER